MQADDEETRLLSTALQNVQSLLSARQRAESELLRTKEALEEETRILELLYESGSLLASKLDLQGVVQAVTDAGTQLSGAQFGAFFYSANAAGGSFTLCTVSGAPLEAFSKFEHPRATPIFGPTFRGEGVVRLGDVRADPRYGQWAPYFGLPAGHLPVCSYLAVPVKARSGEVIGGLFFGHCEPEVFSERAERLIVGFAAQAAIAIDNARLYEETKRSAEERARLLEAERAARVEVERVSLMKDEFLATLSHELRTPLNAVLGWSEVLLSRAPEHNVEQRRGLEAIARNARAQAQLIADLLDMNRIISGKLRLDVQSVAIARIIESVLDSIRPSLEAKSIVIRKAIEPNVALVHVDPDRLQQVLWNLLTNAVKFTPTQGKIEVLARRVNSHVEISIRDTGIGISADFLPHLFERFRQADSSTTRKYGGLGLGLSIVRQLVELHGGCVDAYSDGDGTGATFIVSLPVRAVSVRPQPAAELAHTDHSLAAAAPEFSLQGVRVLVVDDERDARELVKTVLTDASAEVFEADSADAALAAVQMSRPHVIVSDIGMPERDGLQLMRDVRNLDTAHGGRTPAIALTAFARSEDRTRAMLAGYQVHVSKPIEPQELVATVKSLAVHARGTSVCAHRRRHSPVHARATSVVTPHRRRACFTKVALHVSSHRSPTELQRRATGRCPRGASPRRT